MAGMLQRNMDLAEAVWAEIPLESRRKAGSGERCTSGEGAKPLEGEMSTS